MPAPLAQDFAYLLNRMRELSESELALSEWVHQSLHLTPDTRQALYPDEM